MDNFKFRGMSFVTEIYFESSARAGFMAHTLHTYIVRVVLNCEFKHFNPRNIYKFSFNLTKKIGPVAIKNIIGGNSVMFWESYETERYSPEYRFLEIFNVNNGVQVHVFYEPDTSYIVQVTSH
jgi:hypothetical protein